MERFKIFTSPCFGEVKTVAVEGDIYFIGIDVALALGYAKPDKAIYENVDKADITKLSVTKVVIDSDIKIEDSDTTTFILINEAGVNALVSSSEHPQAKEFKEWVTSEIIPSIHETRTDQLKVELQESLEVLPVAQRLLKIHQNFIQEIEERIAKLKSEINSGTGEGKDESNGEAQNDTEKSYSSVNIGSNLNKLPEHLKFILQMIGVIKQENGEWVLEDKYKKCNCPKCSSQETQSN